MNKNLDITPTITVHKLLEAYPQLEDVLIQMATPFKKLKNPVLRKTIAKVATVKHIASVAGLPLNDLISKLREAAGQKPSEISYADQEYFENQPEWFSYDKITLSIDEILQASKDEITLVTLLKRSKEVKSGEIIELITNFLPAPGIDALKAKGYSIWVKKENNSSIKSYFLKN